MQVVVRVRPQLLDMEAGVPACVEIDGHNSLVVRTPSEASAMQFNWVAGPATTQAEFFKGELQQLLLLPLRLGMRLARERCSRHHAPCSQSSGGQRSRTRCQGSTARCSRMARRAAARRTP